LGDFYLNNSVTSVYIIFNVQHCILTNYYSSGFWEN